jgi:hypothetical protein
MTLGAAGSAAGEMGGSEGQGEEGISPATLVRVLVFVCCGKLMLCERDHPSAAMSLLVAAEQLSLAELSRAAEAHLMACVGNDSVCGLLQWADAFLAGGAAAAALGSPGSSSSSSDAATGGAGGCAAPAAAAAAAAVAAMAAGEDGEEEDSSVAEPLTTVAQPPHSSMRGTALCGEVLRAACISHILRYHEAITTGPDFRELPEHLQQEVREAASARHAYSQDLL